MKKLWYLSPLLLLAIYFFSFRAKPNMPSFKLLLLDSVTVFDTKDIPGGKPSILIFFSPDCEHCQAETASILKNMDSLKNVNFYFITTDSIHQMKVFNGYYNLPRFSNITVGRDINYSFSSKFSGAVPPFSVLYDRHKMLRFLFNGETTASQFLGAIRKL